MSSYDQLKSVLDTAKTIVVLQADNPDGDSLGSSLALEAMLSEMGKTVYLVCAVNIPDYLRYLDGWSRVQKDIPTQFDATIIVDNSTETLFENYTKDSSFAWIKSKPVIVIDHHIESSGISYANVNIIEAAVATSEIIYKIACELAWPMPLDACEMMAVSIMSDSVGLMNDATTATSIRVIADLVEHGVSLAKIDDARRELMRKDPSLIPFKGELLQRVNFNCNGRLASVVVEWPEIERYSPLYNPTMLVIDDMRLVTGVDVAIGYKHYKDGKVTAKIRCNYGKPIASDLASAFGGGGHEYAAGFKITDGRKLADIQRDVALKTTELLDSIKQEKHHEN